MIYAFNFSQLMDLYELKHDIELTPGIAKFFGMFQDNRRKLNRILEGVTDEMVDFTPKEENIESIGTLLYHIAAVEIGWIFYDIDKQELDDNKWKYGFATRDENLKQLTGKGLQFYRDMLQDVRNQIFERFKKFSDDDLKRVVESEGENFTIEWIFFHLINHEAMHTGQISLLKRLCNLQKQ